MTIQEQERMGSIGSPPTTRAFWVLGNRLTILADDADTQGRYDLVSGLQPPGNQTPPHRHTRYDELLYVVDGELTIWAGTEPAVLHAGDTFNIPAGTAHVVSVSGDAPAQALVIASPSGFARLIAAAGVPDSGASAHEPTADDLERFTRLAAAAGDEILGPPGALPPE